MRRVIATPRRAPQLGLLLVVLVGVPGATADVNAATVDSLRLRATYDVQANFSWASYDVSVHTLAHVTNPTASVVSTLAFNLAPLRIGRNPAVGLVTVGGSPVAETIDDQTILVPLSPALPSGGNTDVVINYTARLSINSNGDNWQFARLGGYMTAYRWIPWLSRAVRFNRPSASEPWVTPSSSYVRVALTTDRTLKVASSGKRISLNGLTQTFEARNVRDFNFSAAPDYLTASRTVNGKKITFFYKSLNATRVLDWTAKAFKAFSANIGAYPYEQLNVAEIGPWADIESPSLFWLRSNLPRRLLPWTVAHETAHMWFYSVVGSDQALEPFADEAVSDFIARKLVGTWASSQCAPDDLDQTIYDLGACYPWVIYVQGNLYLRAYFNHVGAADFWQGLRNYYNANRFGMGGTREVLDALDAASGYHPNHALRFPTLYP